MAETPTNGISLHIPIDGPNKEEWARGTEEPEIGNVSAIRLRGVFVWAWQVYVNAMEHVHDVPLERTLRKRIIAALRAVPGVARASEEDRELWIVDGQPSGAALVAAVAAVIDEHAPKIALISPHVPNLRLPALTISSPRAPRARGCGW